MSIELQHKMANEITLRISINVINGKSENERKNE